MRWVYRAALALCLAVVLTLAITGCGGHDPSGSVTELSYVPAHRGNVEVDDYILICMGNPIMCIPEWVGSPWEERSFDAQWNATLMRCPDGECSSESISITKEQYDTWSVGDWYPAVLRYPGLRHS